ncbi:hypothetical protein DCAR_0625493 [Daucus carota subsp. sativus]|uniref:Uncharacterized protein n=1 Tax=Daucus carota subsp. sativus TaxID=79200 RepID=A0A164WHF4_DAUCS|nr:PREDICTED: WD repeat-containing protein 44-like [Daucus carota subsp. sativus]WOH06070.1 hypothetical protein DCAR_0625493 [Daucus carota subsp. sativus]
MDRRRKLTMNWERSGDDDDNFFEPHDSGSDDEDYDDGRMSFSSAVSSAPFEEMRSLKSSTTPKSMFENHYDMWMAEPGSIQDRRKRLLKGMGLNSNKDLLSSPSSRSESAAVSEEAEKIQGEPESDDFTRQESKKEDETDHKDESHETENANESIHKSLPTALVHVRSRSDGELAPLTFDTERRKDRIMGAVSKHRLVRTSSVIMTPDVGACSAANCMRFQPKARSLRKFSLNRSTVDGELGSLFVIKNLDTGAEFVVSEYNGKGMWNKLSDLHTGKQMTMEEFEKSIGYSPSVKEAMSRANVRSHHHHDTKGDTGSIFSKRFRNSKRKGVAFLKNIKDKANARSGFKGDRERSQEQSTPEQRSNKNSSSEWVKVHHHGKPFRDFTGLHLCQEIQAHEGSIWTIKFSSDARFLASAGEDKVIHVWEVQECDVMSAKPPDDVNSPAEIKPMQPEKRTKGRHSSKKRGNSIPDYVEVPETVFGLSERPICSFTGHQDDILDLSWSKSQLLLSSSMDKTVRLWDMETQNCLKMFAHNDYVTCIQFNPVDDDYFLSGSLDAKIRIWNVPHRQVVDWMDISEMVTAVCYSPDGQGAVVGSHKGTCRLYSTADSKLEQKENIEIPIKKKAQPKKFTGFQYNPSNPSEMLITSADSRIRIFNGSEITYKFRGFQNTSSQIASSFSPDGNYIISASEDSQVYIWKREESRNAGHRKNKNIVSIPSHEHFQCRDVSVAIPWPGSSKNEVPIVEVHSRKHSKRINQHSQPGTDSPPKERAGTNSKRQLPPLPKQNNQLERVPSCSEKDLDQISCDESGRGDSFDSASTASTSSRYDPSSISSTSRHSGSWSWFDVGHCHGHTMEATAWGLVIVTAGLGGEIRAYQNFGLPVKVSRHSKLFRDLT